VERGDGTWELRDTNLRGADPDVVRLRDGSYRAYTKEPDGSILSRVARRIELGLLGTAFRDEAYPNATDPDVFETPPAGHAAVARSASPSRHLEDGIGFTAAGVVKMEGDTATVKIDTGWRTYFHVNANPQTGGRMVIRSAITADGVTWRLEPGDRVLAPPDGPARYGVADPAPLRRANGTWIMLVKSFITEPGR
jgi:hypothetical protein